MLQSFLIHLHQNINAGYNARKKAPKYNTPSHSTVRNIKFQIFQSQKNHWFMNSLFSKVALVVSITVPPAVVGNWLHGQHLFH
jgi:hypothetical protein